MLEFIYKFSWESIKFDYQVLACLLVIWMVVVVCSIFSVLSRPFTPLQRSLWILAIVALPPFGLMFYLPFSMKVEQSPEMMFARRVKR